LPNRKNTRSRPNSRGVMEEEPDDDNNQEPGLGVSFNNLWNNYPGHHIDHKDPKTKNERYKDQCAIELSEALIKSGVDLKGFKGGTCENCSLDEKHALVAQELANYLLKKKIEGILKPVFLTGENFEAYVFGKTGIIYFQDYWHRTTDQSGKRTGDHIDLWNKNQLGSMNNYLGRRANTWFRLTFPTFSENHLSMSDLTKSKSVIFWEVK